MPSPSSGVTFRPDLGQGYLELDLAAASLGYIWSLVCPISPSEVEAGRFPKVVLESLLPKVSLDDIRRGIFGDYARDDWEYTSDTFACEEYGKEERIDRRQAAIMRRLGLMPEQLSADRGLSILLRAIEQSVQSVVHDATTYSSQYTAVTNEWDDAANATPVTDLKGAIERFEARNGFGPNTLVLNKKQARNVLLTAQVQTMLGYRPTEGERGEQLQGNLQSSVLEQVLGIPSVLVADGWKNTALPGASASLGRVWSDEYVALLTVGSAMDIRMPSFGRTFVHTADGVGADAVVMEEYYQPEIRSDVIRTRSDLQVKVVHSELLEGLSNITT